MPRPRGRSGKISISTRYARETGLPLRPVTVVQEDGTAPPGDGLLRQWPRPAAGVHKHYGYAFQWFALSALILGLYAWFQLIRPRRARQRQMPEPLGMTVHGVATPDLSDPREVERSRTLRGRVRMLLVLLVCAAPVIASYLTYFVIRPEGRSNYGTLILPTRGLPALALRTLDGVEVPAAHAARPVAAGGGGAFVLRRGLPGPALHAAPAARDARPRTRPPRQGLVRHRRRPGGGTAARRRRGRPGDDGAARRPRGARRAGWRRPRGRRWKTTSTSSTPWASG